MLKKYINAEYIIANELKSEERRKLFLSYLNSNENDKKRQVCDRMKDIFEGKVIIEKHTIK